LNGSIFGGRIILFNIINMLEMTPYLWSLEAYCFNKNNCDLAICIYIQYPVQCSDGDNLIS